MKIYDNQFNANEWFVLIGLCIGIAVVAILPKRFSKKNSIVFFMCGVYSGFFFDHSLSVQPVSFYDVNDKSSFEVMDFISYWMYGPFSYLFFYFFDRLKIKPSYVPIYLLVSALIGIGCEWCAVKAGVFHYDHGYTLYYSLPIYLIVHTIWIALYYRFQGMGSGKSNQSIQ